MELWCNSKGSGSVAYYGGHGFLPGRKLLASSSTHFHTAAAAAASSARCRVVLNSSSSLQEGSSRVSGRSTPLPVADAVAFEDDLRHGFRNPSPRFTDMTKRRDPPSEKTLPLKKSKVTYQPLVEEHESEEPPRVEHNKAHLTQTRFDAFPISPLSIKALHSVLKYETMTVVQEATFPVILEGSDVMAKARTGTGKTIAFLLPAIELILKESGAGSRNQIYAVIVCPTRELAQQVSVEAKQLLTFHRNLSAQAVYGGTNIRREQSDLSQKLCQILVGTPGRLVDHIQNTPNFAKLLRSVKLFVLDEADRMLDMGFKESLDQIRRALPTQRQNLLFSATIPKEVHNIAKSALKPGFEFVDTVGEDSEDTHAKVKQQCIVAPLKNQLGIVYSILRQHIQEEPHYKVLVFCTTARVTGFMFSLFEVLGFNCREIHSRKSQSIRNRVSDEFRKSKGGIILFTSDVSARGIDYPDVTLVIQVGAASDVEQYVHRLGRTGRAGKGGEGLLVLTPWEEFFHQKLLQKFPIGAMTAPGLALQEETKILSAASKVDLNLRTMAYQSWIGYYTTLKGLKLDKNVVVDYANQFSSMIGFREPPALPKMVVKKMGLLGVRGLKVF